MDISLDFTVTSNNQIAYVIFTYYNNQLMFCCVFCKGWQPKSLGNQREKNGLCIIARGALYCFEMRHTHKFCFIILFLFFFFFLFLFLFFFLYNVFFTKHKNNKTIQATNGKPGKKVALTNYKCNKTNYVFFFVFFFY